MSLIELVRTVLSETSLSDPREVADEVLRRLRGGPAMRDALAEALPMFVRTQFTRGRMLSAGASVVARTGGPSARVAGVRDAWARRVETPVFVGAAWKRLAECTAGDLRTVAAALRSQAEQSKSKADYYEALARALPPGGVVGDLDADPVAVTA